VVKYGIVIFKSIEIAGNALAIGVLQQVETMTWAFNQLREAAGFARLEFEDTARSMKQDYIDALKANAEEIETLVTTDYSEKVRDEFDEIRRDAERRAAETAKTAQERAKRAAFPEIEEIEDAATDAETPPDPAALQAIGEAIGEGIAKAESRLASAQVSRFLTGVGTNAARDQHGGISGSSIERKRALEENRRTREETEEIRKTLIGGVKIRVAAVGGLA
jgi:hypothetical protein